MLKLLFIGLGGFVGAIARYLVSIWMLQLTGILFLGTMVVNVLGCFLLGFGATLAAERELLSEPLRALMFIGVLGAFTTFSTFSFETLVLVKDGQLATAALNVGGSLVLGLAAVWFGYWLARVI